MTDGSGGLQKCLTACENVVSFPGSICSAITSTLEPGTEYFSKVFDIFCWVGRLRIHFLFITVRGSSA